MLVEWLDFSLSNSESGELRLLPRKLELLLVLHYPILSYQCEELAGVEECLFQVR